MPDTLSLYSEASEVPASRTNTDGWRQPHVSVASSSHSLSVFRSDLRGQLISRSSTEEPSPGRARKSMSWLTTARTGKHLELQDLGPRAPSLFQGPLYNVVLGLVLLMVLLLPDLWVLWGLRESLVLEVALLCLVSLLALEVLVLSLADADYFWTFHFVADAVGTSLMIANVLLTCGPNASRPLADTDSGGFLPPRAAHAAAGAGCLFRALRVIALCSNRASTPCNLEERQSRGVMQMLSSHSTKRIAESAAVVILIAAMLIPVWQQLSSQRDLTLRTWVEAVSATIQDSSEDKGVAEMQRMADFFERRPYGPFRACLGQKAEHLPDGFECQKVLQGWRPLLTEPARMSSVLLVHTESLEVSFNLDAMLRRQAEVALFATLGLLLLLVVSHLSYARMVQLWAIRPLQSIFSVIQELSNTAKQLSLGENGNSRHQEEDSGDLSKFQWPEGEQVSELGMLDKVADQLAGLARVRRAQTSSFNPRSIEEEGLATMLAGGRSGTNSVSSNFFLKEESSNLISTEEDGERQGLSDLFEAKLQEWGISHDTVDSYDLQPLNLAPEQQRGLAFFLIATYPSIDPGFFVDGKADERLRSLVHKIQFSYNENPFHNFAHALDVLHTTSRLLQEVCAEAWMTTQQQQILLVAALGHDVHHPGVNNGFLVETGHELALLYNDRSPLENMHASKLWELLAAPDANIFCELSREQTLEARRLLVTVILSTDMAHHQALIKELLALHNTHRGVFEQRDRVAKQLHGRASFRSGAHGELDIFAQPDNQRLLMKALLHLADVGNVWKPWEVAQAWAEVCLKEFFAQGDQEKALGIPVQFLNDRHKVDKAESQIGFIEYFIVPLVAAEAALWPPLSSLKENLAQNVSCWYNMWLETKARPSEEKERIRTRVESLQEQLAGQSSS